MKQITLSIMLAFMGVVLVFPGRLLCAEPLTMESAVAAALSANTEIAAAGHATDAALARPPQAATPPDPQFMVDFIDVPTNTADVSQRTIQYMVEQQVPFPTKLINGYKAEKRAAEAVAVRHETAVQELTRQVKNAWVDLWVAEEKERVERETLSLLRQNKRSAEESYATLKGPVTDAIRAVVEEGDIEGRLALLGQERLNALATLSRLMATPLDPAVHAAGAPTLPKPIDLQSLIAQAKTSRPEVLEAERTIASEDARVAMAQSQYAPDVVLRWGFMDNPSGTPNGWYGRAGISVPLWSLSKQRFGVRESKALLAKAQSLKEAALLTAESDVRSAHARFIAARRTAEVFGGSVVPRARLLLRSSQEAYADGKGDFLGIVDAVRSLANAQLMLVQARADVAKAAADLERAAGNTPIGEKIP